MAGPDPSPGLGPSASRIRPFPGALIACGEEEPVPTPPASPWARTCPHRHGPAAVQTLDGCLSFPLTPKFYKGTAWSKIDGLGQRGKEILWPRVRRDHQEIPRSA